MSATEVFDPYLEWLGIEPAQRPADHYRLLGLPPFEADTGKILAAADGRMALIRSYQVGPRGSYTQNLLNELSAAKLCLLSPATKAQYDQMLAVRLQRGALPATFFPTAVPLMALPPAYSPFQAAGVPSLEPPLAAPRVVPLATPIAPPKQARKTDHVVNANKLSSVDEAPRSGPRLRTLAFMAAAVLLIAGGIWGAGKYLTPKIETPDGSDKTAANGEQPPDADPEPPDPAAKATVVLQEGSGDMNLPPSAAALIGETRLKIAVSENVLTGWASPDDAAIWKFKLLRPGFFKLELTYATASESEEAGMELLLDDQVVETFHLKPTGGVDKFETLTHTIVVKSSGAHVLKLHPAAAISEDGLVIKSLRLAPVGGQP